MRYTSRIIHGGTETAAFGTDDWPMVQFLSAKLYEWAQGRRHGEFVLVEHGSQTTIRFTDVTAFSVELTA